MKHIYLLFTVLFCGFLNAQIINFPDANFKAKLLQANSTNTIALNMSESPVAIDTNNNGEIEVVEAQNIKSLNVSNSGISDLSGISSFASLKWLRCANNLLTEIVIDDSILIESLIANNNAISSISVNFASNLEGIDLSYNNLTSFALSDCINWETLNLSHNQLSSLEFTNVSVAYLNVRDNSLSDIQFNGNFYLFSSADFTHNQFTLLDLSAIESAEDATLFLGYNIEDKVLFGDFIQPGNIQYSSNNSELDLGNYHMTRVCDPEYRGNVSITNSPNLQNVILKNGYNHGYTTCYEGSYFQISTLYLGISNCPSLNHICVDEGDELTVVQNRINQLGLQSQVVVDGNCTSSVLGEATFVLDEPFSVSPIPAQNILQITIKNTMTIDSLQVYNNLGQLVLDENGANQSVDVSNLSSGSYFIKINTKEGAFVKQFVKE
jgi:Secretion system C-terminal sorting domain